MRAFHDRDPKGRFLYGYCADGLSLYTLNTSTGAVSELATSPFQASTGQFGVLVIAESSGQFVYLVKSDLLPAPATSTPTLDTFHVDAATPVLGLWSRPQTSTRRGITCCS
jgi:hypothetical protein